MGEILIRRARHEDINVLLEFEQAMIETERPFDPTIKRGRTYYYDIPLLIDSPEVELVVAESGESLIGSGYARVERSEPYYGHSHHSYLGFMYVLPEYRGRGVIQMIINALFDWSRERGVQEIQLEVYSENRAAIKAYEKAGLSSTILTMRRRLD